MRKVHCSGAPDSGFGPAADLLGSFPGTFAGQTITGPALLLRHASYGDANLDGVVDTVDFNYLASNFGASGWVGCSVPCSSG